MFQTLSDLVHILSSKNINMWKLSRGYPQLGGGVQLTSQHPGILENQSQD